MKKKASRRVKEQRTLKVLHNLALALGIRIQYKYIPEKLWGRQINGYYSHRPHSPHLRKEVTIHKELYPAKRIITLAHELGHAALGHGTSYVYENKLDIILMQETEAWVWAERVLEDSGYVPTILYFQRDRHLKNVREDGEEALNARFRK
jgi:hypothetical protein